MWGASLAPTVVPSRGVAPRRSVSRPFHGLRRSQDTRLRALDPAMPAAAVDAQQATSERARALVQHGASVPDQAWMAPRMACRARRARSAVLAIVRAGRKDWALKVGASEHGWMGGAMCMPRGRGRPSRPVASSQAREDCTRPPCWRAIARIVLSRRGRLVSRVGQKKEKSTTCEPSMLQRSAWSRPPSRQRSACTSLPRRAHTRHWKWAG